MISTELALEKGFSISKNVVYWISNNKQVKKFLERHNSLLSYGQFLFKKRGRYRQIVNVLIILFS